MFPSQRDKGARTLITQTQGYADESQDGVLGGLMIPSEKGECSNAGGGILNTQTICFGFLPPGDLFLHTVLFRYNTFRLNCKNLNSTI